MVNVYLDNQLFPNAVISTDGKQYNLKDVVLNSFNHDDRTTSEFSFISIDKFNDDPVVTRGSIQKGIFVDNGNFYDVVISNYDGTFVIDRFRNVGGSLHRLLPIEVTADWYLYTLYR